jgi:2,4-dienoyl-CoA reductase-like NADH-dependent reductase (Old Yellow Enzyme family)
MSSVLFQPLKVNEVTLANRVVVAPMCQYSALEGNATDWHLGHLLQLAISGAGLLMLEATAVNSIGKITHNDLSLYTDDNENSLNKLLASLRKYSDIPIGIQISHSGRKGSAELPWVKPNTPLNISDGGWQTVSPSAISRTLGWPEPKELTVNQIEKLRNDFKNTTIRARRLNFDCMELHIAHGYLLHQFISPISNRRSDDYGGSLQNRCRLPLEIGKEMRDVWPKDKLLGARVTGKDWLEGGWSIEDCIFLVEELKSIGFDYVCVSSGGILPITDLEFKPGYQVHLARDIKRQTGMITRTAGMITTLEQATEIIETESADLIALGKVIIRNPRWVFKAAKNLGAFVRCPQQYERCLNA